MTYQAYLDTIKKKTGKTPEDFKKLAADKGLQNYPELMAWLKSDFELGHGHANVIAQIIAHADEPKVSADEKIDSHFSGAKATWRGPYDDLLKKLKKFGDDVAVGPTSSYISLLRGKKKFAVVQITAKRMDIGIKLANTVTSPRLEESGPWNAMVTHRLRVEDPAQIDSEVLGWLRQAYDNA